MLLEVCAGPPQGFVHLGSLAQLHDGPVCVCVFSPSLYGSSKGLCPWLDCGDMVGGDSSFTEVVCDEPLAGGVSNRR